MAEAGDGEIGADVSVWFPFQEEVRIEKHIVRDRRPHRRF